MADRAAATANQQDTKATVMAKRLRLGVNIDHVATVRNARGGIHPDPVRAAHLAMAAGADGITAHLREDRRHITDEDISRILREVPAPLNMELAAVEGMVALALAHKPHAACIVPERRQERTTEGGLDAVAGAAKLAPIVQALGDAGVRVSLFIEPSPEQLEAARALGVPAVELHTGSYCNVSGKARQRELDRIRVAAAMCEKLGLECHAGHGLTYDNVGPIAAIPAIVELNIGHFLVGEAIFCGLETSIRRMRNAMNEARAGAGHAAS
jgi:pyridoxine 5-phosphate synthase